MSQVVSNLFAIHSHHSQVVELRLARPQALNALDLNLIQELLSQLQSLATQKGVRALIIRGEGSSFCSGADLRWMQMAGQEPMEQNIISARLLESIFDQLDALNIPILMLLEGMAYGGGLGLLLCADTIIGRHGAKMALPEVRIGLVPALVSRRLLLKLGPAWARHWALTGQPWGVQEAQNMGLVHQIVQDENELERAKAAWISNILSLSPQACKVTKQLLRQELKDLALVLAQVRASSEAQIGMEAFFKQESAPWHEIPG